MRELANICLRCRTRLLVASSTRPARQAISHYSTAAQDTPAPPKNDDEREPSIGYASRPPGKRRRYPTATPTSQDRLSSLEIFKNVVQEQQRKEAEAPKTTPAETAANLSIIQDAATLQLMLQDRGQAATSECFNFFESKIYPVISRPEVEVPEILRDRVGRALLDRTSKEKANNIPSKDLPTVSRLSQLYLELGLLQPQRWGRLTLKLLDHVCGVSTSPDDSTSIGSYETTMAQRDALLHDLLGAWKVLNVQKFTALRVGGAAKAANQVGPPSLSEAMKIQLSSKNLPRNPLGVLFPQYHPNRLGEVTAAAIATYVLLTDPIYSKRAVRLEAGPFLKVIARILTIVRPDQQQLQDLFNEYPNIIKYVSSRWPAVEIEIHQVFQPPHFTRHLVHGNNIHRLVGEAWRAGNVQGVQQAFQEFFGPGPEVPERREELLRHPELFDYFIMAYMAMRQPKLAVGVWNSMARVGIEPTLKTWTAMLDGCLRARNLHGFKSVWDRLVQSGIQLDTAIWTARISGLIALGEPDSGLAALATMAKLWNQKSTSGKAHIAVKPSIEPVNAAMVGLLRLDKLGAAKSVLAWAGEQGIEPDIYTFNTLLRSLVSQGLTQEVKQIFQIMKARNVEADVVTFTIIMDQVLAGVGRHEPQKQVQIVNELLSEMEAAGAKANMMAYAKMIHILLEEGDQAAESVKTVMSHIWSNGLELTSHIYTMLVEHYFSRDPPDVAAVTALIENRRLHDNRTLDRVFWERIIQGYCQTGHTARAQGIFDKINKPGIVITFATRHDLLRALVDDGEMQAAQRLVEESLRVRRMPDTERGDENLRSWKHRFWHLAMRYGLLKGEAHSALTKATERPSGGNK